MTKQEVVKELRRLFKPRIYIIQLWKEYYVRIVASWEGILSSDGNSIQNFIAIDIDIDTVSSKKRERTFTFDHFQTEMTRFQSDIDLVLKECSILAKKEKRKMVDYFLDELAAKAW